MSQSSLKSHYPRGNNTKTNDIHNLTISMIVPNGFVTLIYFLMLISRIWGHLGISRIHSMSLCSFTPVPKWRNALKEKSVLRFSCSIGGVKQPEAALTWELFLPQKGLPFPWHTLPETLLTQSLGR